MMVISVNQVKIGIRINASVIILKKIVYVKKTIFRNLLHVVVKMTNIFHDSMIRCDEIIEEANTVDS